MTLWYWPIDTYLPYDTLVLTYSFGIDLLTLTCSFGIDLWHFGIDLLTLTCPFGIDLFLWYWPIDTYLPLWCWPSSSCCVSRPPSVCTLPPARSTGCQPSGSWWQPHFCSRHAYRAPVPVQPFHPCCWSRSSTRSSRVWFHSSPCPLGVATPQTWPSSWLARPWLLLVHLAL